MMTKSHIGNVMLLLMFSFLCQATSRDEETGKNQMKSRRLGGTVYVIEGAGGNIGASIGEDGVVLVDDEVEPLVDETVTVLKSISDKPVKFVINTHYHDDHTGGNAYFHKLATIIAHENVRRRLKSGGISGNGSSIHIDVKPTSADALPSLTFLSEMTLHLNGEDMRVVHFPAAHTDGDAVVFFPSANVVEVGDIYVTYGFPFIDIDSGGSIDGLIDAVEKVIAQMPADAKIVPGHGPVSTIDDLQRYLGMLKATRNAVLTALTAGKTLDQMRRARILDPWKKYSGDFVSEDAFLETLYESLHKERQNP